MSQSREVLWLVFQAYQHQGLGIGMLCWHIFEHVSTLQHSSVPLSPAMAVCVAIDANIPAEIQPLLLII